MNRIEVVKKLNNRGFNAQERDVVKNGVVLKVVFHQLFTWILLKNWKTEDLKKIL